MALVLHCVPEQLPRHIRAVLANINVGLGLLRANLVDVEGLHVLISIATVNSV